MVCAFWDAPWLFNKVRANSERLPVSVGKNLNAKCFALEEAGFLLLTSCLGRGGLLHCAVVADISGEKQSQGGLQCDVCQAAKGQNPWPV